MPNRMSVGEDGLGGGANAEKPRVGFRGRKRKGMGRRNGGTGEMEGGTEVEETDEERARYSS